jgi:predicted site-specific integrase-resolvase
MTKTAKTRKTAAPDARLLNREQAAGRLGVSVQTLDRWTRKGYLHPIDLFAVRRVLFSAAEIDELVAARSRCAR